MIDKHTTEKSILFISFHFPPDAKVGAKRIAKLAGFMKDKGYKVGVLTVKEKYYGLHDYSLCDNDLEIYRTGMFPNIRSAYIGMKGLLARLSGRTASDKHSAVPDLDFADIEAPPSSGFLSRIRSLILSIIWLPDDKQGWVPFGFFKCLMLLRKHRIIYSSSPPHSVHLIPLFASFLFRNISWVTEFRDPWVPEWKPSFARSRFSDWLENLWRAAIMKKSSRVIVVTEAMKNSLAAEFPQYESKIGVYYNGYDENEFKSSRDSEERISRKVTFAHAGAFYHGRDPKIFMTAVSELISAGRINKNDVRINFIGDSHIDGRESIVDFAEMLNIGEITGCQGYVPNKECLGELNRADVLLLFSIEQPQQVPAKFYEYLALEKNILSITTGGMTSELIDRTGSGLNVSPDDIQEMKEAVMKMISGRLPERNEMEIGKFSIYSIFNRLSEDLDNLMEEK